MGQIKTTRIRTLNHIDFNCPTRRDTNRIKPNITTLTTAEHTFQVHPLATKLPLQPWFTLGWYMPPFHVNGNYRYMHVTDTVCNKISNYFCYTFSQKMLWIRTKNSECLTWESDTLSNDKSDIITQCLHRQIFRARKKNYICGEEKHIHCNMKLNKQKLKNYLQVRSISAVQR
jgi:hypothetical protein